MLARPRNEMDRIWSFLGMDTEIPGLDESISEELTRNPDADWQQYKAGDIVQILQKGKHGSWRELFTKRDSFLFEEIAGESLMKWGYEINSEEENS